MKHYDTVTLDFYLHGDESKKITLELGHKEQRLLAEYFGVMDIEQAYSFINEDIHKSAADTGMYSSFESLKDDYEFDLYGILEITAVGRALGSVMRAAEARESKGLESGAAESI